MLREVFKKYNRRDGNTEEMENDQIVLEVSRLSLAYGKRMVLKDVSLQVMAGEFGPSRTERGRQNHPCQGLARDAACPGGKDFSQSQFGQPGVDRVRSPAYRLLTNCPQR